MSVTVEAVQSALKSLIDPNTKIDFVTAKNIKNLRVEDGNVSLDIVLGYPAKSQFESIRKSVINAVREIAGVKNVSINVSSQVVAHAVQRGVKLLPGVKNIIAVASGKGGVGKSTTAVNLALALAAEGAQVGILDADIYGPSQPMMLGITGRPESIEENTIEPMEGHGLQASSIGFLIEADAPMVWRGPMVTSALEQLLRPNDPFSAGTDLCTNRAFGHSCDTPGVFGGLLGQQVVIAANVLQTQVPGQGNTRANAAFPESGAGTVCSGLSNGVAQSQKRHARPRHCSSLHFRSLRLR